MLLALAVLSADCLDAADCGHHGGRAPAYVGELDSSRGRHRARDSGTQNQTVIPL